MRFYLSCVFLVVTLGSVKATPIPAAAQAQSQIRHVIVPSITLQPIQLGAFQTLTTTSGANTAFAEANLAAGTVKSSYTGTVSGGSLVLAWDFLSFDIPGGTSLIDFSLAYDGSLANLSPTGYSYVDIGVYVQDVTGYSAYFQSFSGFQTLLQNNPADRVGCAYTQHSVQGASFVNPVPALPNYPIADGICPGEVNTTTVDSTGSPHSYDGTVSGSFVASAGRVYVIQLLSLVSVGGVSPSGTADFANTSTFRFTDLGTATGFTSASGEFLTAQVPEPATSMLSGLGIAGLALSAELRRRRRQTLR